MALKKTKVTAPERIVMVCPSLDLEKNIGGISSVAGFIIKNNTCHRYTHFELGKYDKEKRSVFYYFRIIKGWVRWFFLMTFSKDLLVHFNIALEKRSLIRDAPLLLYAQLLRRRMIVHIHGGFYLEKEEIPGWIRLLIRRILSGRQPKIVLSSVEEEIISGRFNARNIFVLPNSLDIKEAKEYKRIHSDTESVKLLFIGRVVKDKGIGYILQALEVLKEMNIPFNFMMAGVGADKDEYVRRFTETLGQRFEYKGVVSGDSKTSLLKECNVFLLPSFYEGLPISLLEGMSFAQVPVVTDVGSIGKVVKEGINGIIIGKHSSEDIVKAILKLVNERELIEKLGTNARQFIFENFDPETYIIELNKIYGKA